uniref:Repeat domain-containing protein n=1 Tax=Candidatus Kentrum sp. DK TaxID=2126562 RepID=A0A450T976_9GAMM|nr:MAG: Repeat domain-containing protein [Candidatus Kentron sp. DK]
MTTIRNPANPNTPPSSPNDAIIGKAFRWSVGVLLAAAVLVAAGVALVRYVNAPREPVDAAPVAGPRPPSPAAEELPPPVSFRDVTARADIDFVHVNGAESTGGASAGEKLLPETMGGGVALFDYDRDGNQDILFVNGNHWPGSHRTGDAAPTTALYRNDGSGHFTDVSGKTGLDVTLQGMGVAVGDIDNDGWVDVFLSAVGGNRLFRNEQGTFRDVTQTAGVAGAPGEWSTGGAFIDYDNDGDLDLFVGNYVRWSPDIDRAIGFQLTGIGRAYGPPTTFAGTYPYLYRNDGDGHFTDISRASGVQVNNPATGAPMAKTLGVVPVDVDADGYLDIFLANDTVRNFLFHNQGDGTFRERGIEFGIAFDRNGAATGAMGTDAAHYRNDQALGIAVGNFANEMTSLYVTQGGLGGDYLQFADEAIGEGIGTPSRLALTFGLFFFDYDLDGRLDLFQANGHLEQEINQVQASQHYEQAPQLFWNGGPEALRGFTPVTPEPEDGLARSLVGRGAAFGDLDNDGDLDIVLTQVGRAPVLLRNDQALGHHWLRIRLVGGGTVNRDAIGARVELTAGGITQHRQIMPTRSYLSQVELPVTFGLGDTETVEAVRVFWPDGSRQELAGKDVRVDSMMTIAFE